MIKKINLITVNYYTDDFVLNLLKKLQAEGVVFNFIIADNSHTLDIGQLNKLVFQNNKLTLLSNNQRCNNTCLSHITGLNLALSGLNFNFPYTLIADPDIIFTTDTINRIIRWLEKEKLDTIGIHKFYQWHKIYPDIDLPYIWFTLIRTKHLKNFRFKYYRNNLISKILKKFRLFPRRYDSGDSIYELFRKGNLKYQIIKKFPKTEQANWYPFKNINTDDWIDNNRKIIISHFRSGSEVRIHQTHGKENKIQKKRFIKNSENFFFKEELEFKEQIP